jgi:hypothetical protein
MNIQCTELDNLLMEGDAFSMEIAERHARDCAACAEKLASWKEISSTARGMHTTWQNDMLWPRIERSLKQERPRTRIWIWQVAAAIVLFAGLGGVIWKVNQVNHENDHILNVAAVDEVEQAERNHLAAIQHLEKLAGQKLDDPSTPLLVSYKEKLMLLDDAIAECQSAIDQNRANTQVRKQLLAVYSEKQRTLQDVLREDNRVSHQ